MSRPALAWLFCLVGCAACRSPTDADLYLRAVTRDDVFSDAWAACGGIDAQRLQGDCQLAVLERFDRLRERDCQAVSSPLWHEECLFLLAERQRAAGELATGISTCHRTRFARKCSWHLLQDEVEASLGDPPAQAEARLEPFAQADFLPDAGRQFWSIRFREQSAGGVPVDEADCDGLVDPAACREGLIFFVHTLLDARHRVDRGGVCASEPGRRVTVRGQPAWRSGSLTRSVEAEWIQGHCQVMTPG